MIHETALIEEGAVIGAGTKVWHYAHIRPGAHIGQNCIIGRGVYIGDGVTVGDCVKIQNYALLYAGTRVENGVFIGPNVCITNDRFPRAVNSDGTPKTGEDWRLVPTVIEQGASLGAATTVVAGCKVGMWSMIGAGSLVSRSIPPYALAFGNPSQIRGVISPSGEILSRSYHHGSFKGKNGEMVEIVSEWCP